jgi:hypothetical protein
MSKSINKQSSKNCQSNAVANDNKGVLVYVPLATVSKETRRMATEQRSRKRIRHEFPMFCQHKQMPKRFNNATAPRFAPPSVQPVAMTTPLPWK